MAGLVVLFGLMIGSFLNVVIARLPAGKSLWRPRSACPTCGAQIAWHDNIPVLSYLLLRARCRACGGPISIRYPIVEAATGLAFLAAWARFGAGPEFVIAIVLLSALIAITVIDLDLQIIPDAITLPGILAGIVASVATGWVSWVDSLLGIALGGGAFLAIILVSGGGMGGGDMKLGAMLGAFLGWKLTVVAMFLSVVVGGTVAIGILATGRKGRKDAIPFGPFLALGGAVALFWGQGLLTWYLEAFAVG